MCYIDNLTQIIEFRNLEVRYTCFEIKYKYKVDSNSIHYINNRFSSSVEDENSKSSHHKLSIQSNWIPTT
jgi:hypothetical protein